MITYNLNGKNIKIPEDEIKNNMEILEISREDAIQMYLEDEGYLDNEDQLELCQKAKENKSTNVIQAQSKAERKSRKGIRKENPTKENLIKALAEMLQTYGADNIKVENVGKLITFTLDSKDFKLDLIERRKPKNDTQL